MRQLPQATKALAMLFIAVLVIHLIFLNFSSIPLILSDEVAYLQRARRLAAGLGYVDAGNVFFPGYSFLITPLVSVFGDRYEDFYRPVQFLNCLLASATSALVCRQLMKRFSIIFSVVATFVSSLYPAFLLYSNTAMTETFFVFLFVLFLVLADAAAFRGQRRLTLATLALLCSVHPRGFAVGMGYGVWIFLRSEFRSKTMVLSALSSVVVLVGIYFGLRQSGYSAYLNFLNVETWQRLSFDHIQNAAVIAAGSLWYLTVSSCGLALLGLMSSFEEVVTLYKRQRLGESKCLLPVLCFCSLLLVSLVPNFQDADVLRGRGGEWFVFGRYLDSMMFPLLIQGLCSLKLAGERLANLMTASIVFACLLFMAVAFSNSQIMGNLSVHWVHSIGLFPYSGFVNGVFLSIPTVGMRFFAVCALVICCGVFAKKSVAPLVGGIFVVQAVIVGVFVIRPLNNDLSHYLSSVQTPLRVYFETRNDRILGYDARMVGPFYHLVKLALPPETLMPLSPLAGQIAFARSQPGLEWTLKAVSPRGEKIWVVSENISTRQNNDNHGPL